MDSKKYLFLFLMKFAFLIFELEMIELHDGGKIGMSSDGLGHGSSFFIELPLYKKFDMNSDNSIAAEEKPHNPRKIFPMLFEYSEMDRSLSDFKHLRRKSAIENEELFKTQEDKKIFSGSVELVVDEASIFAITNQSFKLKPEWEKGLSFLTVDDSLSFRKITKRLLCNMGHSVEQAIDGLDFLEKLNIHHSAIDENDIENKNTSFIFPHYEIILIDNNMPNMCGPEATKIARAHGYKGIILGVTGNVNKEQIDEFIEHGVDAVFPKPLSMEDLTNTVKRLLNLQYGNLI
jgi:CheY-like chemotaxis protein